VLGDTTIHVAVPAAQVPRRRITRSTIVAVVLIYAVYLCSVVSNV